jgi:hypothetical protein
MSLCLNIAPLAMQVYRVTSGEEVVVVKVFAEDEFPFHEVRGRRWHHLMGGRGGAKDGSKRGITKCRLACVMSTVCVRSALLCWW